jgi:hypothetical protein
MTTNFGSGYSLNTQPDIDFQTKKSVFQFNHICLHVKVFILISLHTVYFCSLVQKHVFWLVFVPSFGSGSPGAS